MRNIAAGVRADGLGCLVGGLLGSTGMSASPSLVSLEKTSGATSRVIAWSIATWLIVISCLPKFAGLIVNMPRPVMAAALFFNGSLMFVAGVQVAISRPVTLRASVIHRILDFGGVDGAPLFGLLPNAARLDATVHGVDHFHGGRCGAAAQRSLPARIVAL